MGLTGRFDFRRKWTGKIVLRVEEEVRAFWSRSGEHKMKRRWRDAALLDLAAPEMRPLMDLRMRPQYTAHLVEVERAPATSQDRTAAPAGGNVVPLQDPEAPASKAR
jgi:hypothetical protein